MDVEFVLSVTALYLWVVDRVAKASLNISVRLSDRIFWYVSLIGDSVQQSLASQSSTSDCKCSASADGAKFTMKSIVPASYISSTYPISAHIGLKLAVWLMNHICVTVRLAILIISFSIAVASAAAASSPMAGIRRVLEDPRMGTLVISTTASRIPLSPKRVFASSHPPHLEICNGDLMLHAIIIRVRVRSIFTPLNF